MRSKRGMLAPLVATVLLLAVVLPIAALGAPIEEADLDPTGVVYEVNPDAAGRLFLSDYLAGDVWQVDPASGAYQVYEDVTPQVEDARPDNAGQIWWTNNYATFGRIEPAGGDPSVAQVTRWELEGVEALYGLAIDRNGRVWLPEWSGTDSKLYRFDPATGRLCGYSWEGGASSYYVLAEGGQVWLGNWESDQILRLDLERDEVTYWQIRADGEAVDIEPVGLALDESQQLWWAEWNLGALARLEPEIDHITLYGLPVGSSPQMIVPVEGRIAYTDFAQGTVGLLDPALAAGDPADVVSGTLAAEVRCEDLGPGQTAEVTVRSGILAWKGSTASPVWDEGGWLIYQLPEGSAPYGVAESQGLLCATDAGRQKLIRFPLASKWTVHLPLISRVAGP